MFSSTAKPPAHPSVYGFPNRPLQLARRPAVVRPMVLRLLLSVLLLGMGVFAAWTQLPGIVKDFGLRGKGAIASDVRIIEGKCKSHKAILTDCSGTLSFRTLPEHGGQQIRTKLDFLMTFDLDQDADLFIRYDPANPDRNSASWAQNHLWNRVYTVLVMAGLMLAVGAATVYSAFTPLRQARALRASLAAPRPVAVRLSNLRRDGKKIVAAVHWWHGGKERKADQPFRADEEPLFLGDSDHALGLLSSDGVPTVLDSSLSDLELSDAERERILVAASVWPQAPTATGTGFA